MITQVIFDQRTFGITQASLKILRDAIAERISSEIAVVEIAMNELCCGYLVIDKTSNIAVYTGDGFRTDFGGEGGAGYASANALFDLFGIRPIPWEEEIIPFGATDDLVGRRLRDIAEKIIESLEPGEYQTPRDREPSYIR